MAYTFFPESVSQIETKLEDFSGTKAIQRRKQIEASNGFIKL